MKLARQRRRTDVTVSVTVCSGRVLTALYIICVGQLLVTSVWRAACRGANDVRQLHCCVWAELDGWDRLQHEQARCPSQTLPTSRRRYDARESPVSFTGARPSVVWNGEPMTLSLLPAMFEKTCVTTQKNVKSHVFWFWKIVKKPTYSSAGHLITPAFNTQIPKVSTGKSPTSNILLRNADTRNYAS